MIVPRPSDTIHTAWLYRTLGALFTDAEIANALAFKGGTCAAMLGYLDRFSVDLDFDFVGEQPQLAKVRAHMERVFRELSLAIHDKSKTVPQYFLKYAAPEGTRNTLKIDVTMPPTRANIYEPKRFHDIDRVITCQTIETMVANKLVALQDRYEHKQAIAGRDLYDIHHFFMKGYRYNEAVIRERTKKDCGNFFADLIRFIEKRMTTTILQQDLNTLLPYERFVRIHKKLKLETLMFLRDEQERLRAQHVRGVDKNVKNVL